MTDPSEFQALAAAIGCEISAEGARRLLAYLDAMLEENRVVNLTAIRERESAVLLHALDSVAMGAFELKREALNTLDLGTGNGFPGVALACLFPKAHVTLMDRTLKKLLAISRALEAAGFDPQQFDTVQMDASEAPAHGYGNHFDLITSRAVGPPEAIGRLARPLLARNGGLLAWLSEGTEAPKALDCGLRLVKVHAYPLPAPADRVRRLAYYA
ncbi:MAG: class I SAM-dependent methyltransferase [Planctomycetes bacterium]|nr:class I SAM-dependent methyltransferase [Planctomycetota bacterium]HPF13034.1 class I SAM-dependent methyltransferase [Planctomycetota bacterium]